MDGLEVLNKRKEFSFGTHLAWNNSFPPPLKWGYCLVYRLHLCCADWALSLLQCPQIYSSCHSWYVPNLSTCTPLPAQKSPLPVLFLSSKPLSHVQEYAGGIVFPPVCPGFPIPFFSFKCVSLLARRTCLLGILWSQTLYEGHQKPQTTQHRQRLLSWSESIPIPLMYNGLCESLALLFWNLNQNPVCWMKKWEGKMNLRPSMGDLMIRANTTFIGILCSNTFLCQTLDITRNCCVHVCMHSTCETINSHRGLLCNTGGCIFQRWCSRAALQLHGALVLER